MTEPPELWRAVPNSGWQTDKPLIAAVEGWCIAEPATIGTPAAEAAASSAAPSSAAARPTAAAAAARICGVTSIT